MGRPFSHAGRGHLSGLIGMTVMLVAAVLAGVLASVITGPSSAANEVPWRDLPAAEAEWQRAMAAEASIEDQLAEASTAVGARTDTLRLLDGGGGSRAESLVAWTARARALAVERYMLGGSAAMNIQLLNLDAVVDLSYRSELLASQAQAAQNAAEVYAALIADADLQTRVLVEDVDGAQRRVEGLTVDVVRAREATAQAAWVRTIAQVHDLADQEFAANGRRDPSAQDWVELAACESSNRWDVNTGNGFYGAYQFDYQTWFTVGGAPGTRADQAPPEEQTARARLLYSRRGSQPWPECGWHLDS